MAFQWYRLQRVKSIAFQGASFCSLSVLTLEITLPCYSRWKYGTYFHKWHRLRCHIYAHDQNSTWSQEGNSALNVAILNMVLLNGELYHSKGCVHAFPLTFNKSPRAVSICYSDHLFGDIWKTEYIPFEIIVLVYIKGGSMH